jgi:RecB family exonuclease
VSAFELEHDAIVSPSIFLEDLPGPGMEVVRPGGVRGGRVFVREALSMEPIAPDAVTGAAAEWLALRAGARDAADERFHGRAAPYRPDAFAVRDLESYGECPFRFFAERVLALDEEPADEPSRSPRERGVFVHRVLHDFFQAWGGRGRRNITPGDLDEARAVFSEVAERALARLGQAEAAIERQTLLGSAVFEGVAERVLRLEAERPEPVVTRLLEHRLNGQFQLEGPAGRRAVALKGAADRIDVLQGGTFRLIDYKLGRAPDAGRALQLPLYAACVEQVGATGHRALVLAEAGYVAFGSGKPFVPVVSEPAERDEVMREAHERAVAAVEGIERGEFPPRPATPSLCRYCPYSAVCRKDYVVD